MPLSPLNLASLQVQHELTCSRCGHASSLVEEYMHLSLELPEAQVGGSLVLLPLAPCLCTALPLHSRCKMFPILLLIYCCRAAPGRSWGAVQH